MERTNCFCIFRFVIILLCTVGDRLSLFFIQQVVSSSSSNKCLWMHAGLSDQCKTQTAICRLGGKLKTEGKIQTVYLPTLTPWA